MFWVIALFACNPTDDDPGARQPIAFEPGLPGLM